MSSLTKEEINRIIHEARGFEVENMGGRLMYRNYQLEQEAGGIWHSDVPDYTSPLGFWDAWNWAKEEDWFWQFVFWYHRKHWVDHWTPDKSVNGNIHPQLFSFVAMIDPLICASVLAEYLKERNHAG